MMAKFNTGASTAVPDCAQNCTPNAPLVTDVMLYAYTLAAPDCIDNTIVSVLDTALLTTLNVVTEGVPAALANVICPVGALIVTGFDRDPVCVTALPAPVTYPNATLTSDHDGAVLGP